MIIKCYNENHPYLIFIDLEFNNKTLVQFAGLLFKRIDTDTYQLMRSCNQYITTKVCFPFIEYTNITNGFLQENGVSPQDLRSIVFNDFLADVSLKDVMVISHGLKNDRLVLIHNGINLTLIDDHKCPIDGYCTFNNAKRILNREKKVSASDLAAECGYYLHHAHNAYNDVWAEVAIFTYLKKMELQLLQEESE